MRKVKQKLFGFFFFLFPFFFGGRLKYVHRENLFLQHKETFAALMIFAFICTYSQPRLFLLLDCVVVVVSLSHSRSPLVGANPAPTKGSVTFLNEEINLSWHPPAFCCLYGNLFQKRWRNNL